MLLRMVKFYSFLRLSSIPSCVCVCVCVCVNIITFSPSIHLGCLYILAIVNNATMSIGLHVSL